MSKPSLTPELACLERDIIETLLAGLHQWRPDLHYPESTSDMQACVRALLTMYEVKRRPLPEPLPSPCPNCLGTGYLSSENANGLVRRECRHCRHGKVY